MTTAKGTQGITADCVIGQYQFFPNRQCLVDAETSEEIKLPSKQSALLECLIAHTPDTVSKDELIELVWGRTSADDATLARNISELRSALKDKAADPRYIETISKRGYRLLITPKPIINHQDKQGISSWPMSAVALMAIAVIVNWWSETKEPISGPELSNKRVVSLVQGDYRRPRISSDGESFVYYTQRGSKVSVFKQGFNASAPQKLTDRTADQFVVMASPFEQGQYFFLEVDQGDCQVLSFDEVSQLLTPLTACDKDKSPYLDVSINNQRLYYPGKDENTLHYYQLDANKVSKQALLGEFPFMRQHRVSPDDSKLAFVSNKSYLSGSMTSSDVFIMDLKSAELSEHLLGFDAISQTLWFDDDHLLLQGTQQQISGIYLYDLKSKTQTLINEELLLDADYSPVTKSVLGATRGFVHTYYYKDTESNKVKRMTFGPHNMVMGSTRMTAPETLMFSTSKLGKSQIWQKSEERQDYDLVYQSAGTVISHDPIGNNGELIIVEKVGDELTIVSLKDGQQNTVFKGDSYLYYFQASDDAQRFWYLKKVPQSSEFTACNLIRDTQQESCSSVSDTGPYRFSADDKFIYRIKPNQPAEQPLLEWYDYQGVKVGEKEVPSLNAPHRNLWLVDSHQYYYIDVFDNSLKRMDINSGETLDEFELDVNLSEVERNSLSLLMAPNKLPYVRYRTSARELVVLQ